MVSEVQSRNAYCPILVTLLGIITLVSDVHQSNAYEPMLVTLSGIVILVRVIPKYILERIKRKDKQDNPTPNGITRYYAYLTKNGGELVRVTVAVKQKNGKWYHKQCAVHGIHSKKCFVKDMAFFYLGGYTTGWYYEGLTKYPKWFEDENWGWADDKYFNVYAPLVNIEYMKKFPEYK